MAIGKILGLAAAGAVLAGVLVGGGVALARASGEAEQFPSPGKDVFDKNCAACHAAPDPQSRAPALSQLNKMSASTITTALTTGVMRAQGSALAARDLHDVVAYLAAPEAPGGTAWIDSHMCPAAQRTVDLAPAATIASWGVTPENTRRLTSAQAGLKTADLGKLEVAWVFAMPGTTGMRSQGVTVGSTLFYSATQASTLLALDARTGCVKWAARSPSGIRTSLAFGRLGAKGPLALVGGDNAGQVQAVNPRDGKLIWRVDPRHDKTAPLTGSPQIVGGKILVPISGSDVAAAGRPTYECCKGHGAVAALDAASGKVLWTFHTMEDAKPLGRTNSAGAQVYGPSGAPIWSSPSVDLKRGLVLTGTGENTSPPATGTSDSVIALDLATGKVKWVHQALKNDVWNMSCPSGRDSGRKPGVNCFFYDSPSVLRDHDFGAGPVVFRGKGGKDVVLAGQKSGDVWALDAATGKVLWNHKFGPGTALGGVHWGIATDGVRVFAPVADPGVPDGQSGAGLHAVDVATGKVVWEWKATADCADGRDKRVVGCAGRYGLSAAPLVIDGAVLAGSLDGKLWAFDAASGKVLGVQDTARAFETVNGVPGSGGSIDATGVFAGDGMVFVNSGYGQFNQQPGNVLVAFRAKR
jgi:polyvinyl alcohol dehydrogenase (cytochrome)